MINVRILDSIKQETNLWDIVQIQDKDNYRITFYAKVSILNGSIYPFNRFKFDRIIKVNSIPNGSNHCPASKNKNHPEYWINRDVELYIVDNLSLEKWRIDTLMIVHNSFMQFY